MPILYGVTFVVNLFGLVLSLWLGLYLVSRNPRFKVAWLTALTLWSLAGVFWNVLLALNPPPEVRFQPAIMRYLFIFWPAETLQISKSHWLLGWSVAPAVAFWHHATVLMLPGRLTKKRRARIWFGYVLAFLAIIAQTNAASLLIPEGNNFPLNISLQAGSWYTFFAVSFSALILYSVINLARSARSTPSATQRTGFMIMMYATLIAGAVGLASITGSALGLPLPMVVMSILVLIPVGIIGYDVARYSAVMEGRTIQRDFFYHLMLLALVVLVYLIASIVLLQVYQAPQVVLVIIPVLAVITHSLMSTAARWLDWVFFRRETRRLRSSLQRLMRLSGDDVDLDVSLARVLDPLCTSVRATYGLILIFHADFVRRAATYRWDGGSISLKPSAFGADDALHLRPGHFQPPLDEAALLVPLYAESAQLGALVLGRPANGIRYSEDEVASLLNLTDSIGENIAFARHKAEQISQIVKIAERPATIPVDALVSVQVVDNALRNLFDFTYLADTPLAEMELISPHLPQGQVTHLERGKAVHKIMLEAIDRLRPGPAISRDPPPREWYPYLLLRDAYIDGVSNREIMMRLYISEGTFNRTRRSAIRSVTRALGEMELANS